MTPGNSVVTQDNTIRGVFRGPGPGLIRFTNVDLQLYEPLKGPEGWSSLLSVSINTMVPVRVEFY